MKKILFVLIILVSQTLYSQDSGLENSKTSSNNHFGAVILKYSDISEQGALLLGARGGWMIDESFGIGAGIYGLVSDFSVRLIDQDRLEDNSDNVDLIYGGAEVSYMFSPDRKLHFAVNTLLGFGNFSVNYTKINKQNNYHNDFNGGATFFVAEPSVSLMANITSFLRFDFGIAYRFATSLDDQSVAIEDVSGLSGIIALRLGNF